MGRRPSRAGEPRLSPPPHPQREVRRARAEMNFENQEYLDILAKHTDGLEPFRSRL